MYNNLADYDIKALMSISRAAVNKTDISTVGSDVNLPRGVGS